MFSIVCDDSVNWFNKQPINTLHNVLTGLPDMDELNIKNIDEYLKFFRNMAELIFTRLKETGYAIFIQTDRKFEGQWIDKSYHLTDVAYKNGMKLIWHKIVLQRDVSKTDLHRPTYSHVLCYTKTGKPGASFNDVFPVGNKLYANATPDNACNRCAEYIKTVNKKRAPEGEYDIVDPFVGRGTVGKCTLELNMSFLGIDIDEKQCKNSESYLKNINIT